MSQGPPPDSSFESSPEPEPSWHLLPHRPAEFFGLEEGFDRKQLKRAYNGLLRRFKPDKHPEEFQKLRAAYETLDAGLRYGQTPLAGPAPLAEYQWDKPTLERQPTPVADNPIADIQHDERVRLERPKSLLERLDSESPEALYQELSKNPKSPFDYFALAVLSDRTSPASELMFLKWLLTGLKRFPEQPALTQLLTAYFQSNQIRDEDLGRVLLSVSKIVSTDKFYYLTERLFDRLVLVVAWPQFEKILAACRKNIRDHQVRGSVVFMCHLARRAIWLAPIEACERIFVFLEEHHEYLSDNFEYDLELNGRLFAYVKQREHFVRKGAVATMIDRALRSYCLASGEEGDHPIVTAQAYIAHHPEQLFESIGLAPEEDMQLLVPWIWISDEVEDRLETREPPHTPDQAVSATYQMLVQIDEVFPPGPIQNYNLLSSGISIVITLLLLFALPLVARIPIELMQWGAEIAAITGGIAFFVGAGLVAIYYIYVQPRTVAIWMAYYLRSLIRKHYLA